MEKCLNRMVQSAEKRWLSLQDLFNSVGHQAADSCSFPSLPNVEQVAMLCLSLIEDIFTPTAQKINKHVVDFLTVTNQLSTTLM